MDKRIHIFTGHFGSGKTEFAINFAMELARGGRPVTIVDFDIVNTYFRTMDAKQPLEDMGIRVITPLFANTNLEMQTMPAEVLSVFEDRSRAVVFDVGGDEDGALALGQFRRFFEREGYRMYFVVNTKRPLTQTPEDIISYMVDIERASRLSITDVINNTNLAFETDTACLLSGHAAVEEACRRAHLCYRYISGMPQVIEGLPDALRDRAFPIQRYLQLGF